jgi:hypothetical protein
MGAVEFIDSIDLAGKRILEDSTPRPIGTRGITTGSFSLGFYMNGMQLCLVWRK